MKGNFEVIIKVLKKTKRNKQQNQQETPTSKPKDDALQ